MGSSNFDSLLSWMQNDFELILEQTALKKWSSDQSFECTDDSAENIP